MIAFPNAKINLGLRILGKRPDGYHEIESLLFPIPLTDVLEILPAEKHAMTTSGIELDTLSDQNLCWRALDLIGNNHQIGAVKIHLHKVIPFGGGLGGGSSDAAFTLMLLDKIFNLNLDTEQLEKYAAKIGSDCPFFIRNQPAFATGTGVTLQQANHPSLKNKWIALICPETRISTREAYASLELGDGNSPSQSQLTETRALLAMPIQEWKDHLVNDFLPGFINKYPEIQSSIDRLYALGAEFASMTGSGSTVFGIFEAKPDLEAAGFPTNYFTWSGQI